MYKRRYLWQFFATEYEPDEVELDKVKSDDCAYYETVDVPYIAN